MDYRQPLVAKFMTKVCQWDGESLLSFPKPKDEKELATYKLRLKLTLEETFEVFEAVLAPEVYTATFDPIIKDINAKIDALTFDDMEIKPIDLLDSFADQDYVNVGWANIMGMDLESAFLEVQRSNMTKLDKDGNPIFREDGKLLKSAEYVPPDLVKVFNTTNYKFEEDKKQLTLGDIKSKIKSVQYHIVPDSTTTICSLTLENGFVVNGESSCADPAAFNKEIGERFAYAFAVEKVWPLEGYLLKEKLKTQV